METLEEAAEKYANNNIDNYSLDIAFECGAKWQAERMYREDEVVDLIEDWTKMATGLNMNFPADKFEKWFRQFERE